MRLVLGSIFMVALAGSAQAQSAFDGVYRAPPGLSSGNAGCGTTRFGFPLRVANGVATLQTNTGGTLEGPVGADGSVQIQSQATLVGRITGNQFVGQLAFRGRSSCVFTLDYSKRG